MADLVLRDSLRSYLEAMKLDSKYFDSVRVRPDHARPVERGPGLPVEGLPIRGRASRAARPGPRGTVLSVLPRSRAPVQRLLQLLRRHEQCRGRGLPEGQRDRPSADLEGRRQRLGARHAARWLERGNGRPRANDPHAFFSWRSGRPREAQEARRPLKPLEAKALDSLNLPATATQAEIKSRFKELVKRHHPDANGGDTRSEDKLREVIQAYNYLKQAGLA